MKWLTFFFLQINCNSLLRFFVPQVVPSGSKIFRKVLRTGTHPLTSTLMSIAPITIAPITIGAVQLTLIHLGLIGLLLSGCGTPPQEAEPFTPTFTFSEETTHSIPEGQSYRFGYLEVLENRSRPSGKTIRFPVYLFKSRNPNPKPDPIIYTVGGPGYTSMKSAPYMKYYQYLEDRDFILVEQRGNQYAEPHLDCPEWAEALFQSRLPDADSSQSVRRLTEAAQSCRDRLTKKGIDLDAYHTKEIAADIYELTQALGIQQYNLLTISYSTKIAQTLLRDYPQGIRSVVMDSPLPLAVNYDEESVGNLLRALGQLLDDCAEDPTCQNAFPDLRQRFFQFLREKNKNPLSLEVPHPETGQLVSFRLKGPELIQLFTNASSNDVAAVPREINKVLNGDLRVFQKPLSKLLAGPGTGAGMGMRLSVWCAEEYPFNDQQLIQKETYRYPELSGQSPAVFDAKVCDVWGVKKAAPLENQAVSSDIPVLLMSGEYDEETPAKWAREMQRQFPNSFHLEFRGWKHTVTTNWSNPCGMEAANTFFNDPTTFPQPACLQQLEAFQFLIE